MNQFELFANLLFIHVNILAEWRIPIYHFEKLYFIKKSGMFYLTWIGGGQ